MRNAMCVDTQISNKWTYCLFPTLCPGRSVLIFSLYFIFSTGAWSSCLIYASQGCCPRIKTLYTRLHEVRTIIVLNRMRMLKLVTLKIAPFARTVCLHIYMQSLQKAEVEHGTA